MKEAAGYWVQSFSGVVEIVRKFRGYDCSQPSCLAAGYFPSQDALRIPEMLAKHYLLIRLDFCQPKQNK